MKKFSVETIHISLCEKITISVMIGTDTNWVLNLEKPDLDYEFLCNTTRNGSNIIFGGNY